MFKLSELLEKFKRKYGFIQEIKIQANQEEGQLKRKNSMELQKDTRQMEDEETFLLNKIKEDALQRKAWTSNHSLALNELSSELYNQCNWDEQRIHQYMRGIVETIPGLSYVSNDDSDDSIDLED